MMSAPDKQLSAEQSQQIADTIREEIARRRISRQSLAELAKLSLSTLEKVLGGRRPFTLATTVRLEQALGVSLRKTVDTPAPVAEGAVGPARLCARTDGCSAGQWSSWLDPGRYHNLARAAAASPFAKAKASLCTDVCFDRPAAGGLTRR